jgi:hypothetical protein
MEENQPVTNWQEAAQQRKDFEEKLQLELSKMLLSSSLEFVRGSLQTLQALTGALLTAYLTLLVGFGKQSGLINLPLPLYIIPPFLLGISMVIAFISVLTYKGVNLTPGTIEAAVAAYETVVAARRGHLILPSILTLLGVLSLVIVAICVLTNIRP